MASRWESSKKKLFVKTIWKDGQHHVVLGEREEQEKRKLSSFRSPKLKEAKTQRCKTAILPVKISPKAKSIEINEPTPPPFSYSNYCIDNSLSEKVMLWLDLAIQNRKNFNLNINLPKADIFLPIQEKQPEKHTNDEKKIIKLRTKRQLHIFLPGNTNR